MCITAVRETHADKQVQSEVGASKTLMVTSAAHALALHSLNFGSHCAVHTILNNAFFKTTLIAT
jgi:hypothetical protein